MDQNMEVLQEAGWEELRKEARKIEGDLDVKLSSYAKLGASFNQGGYAESGSPTLGSSRSWKSMEMEIQSLLEKLLDINDSMSQCATSAAPTASITQKLARHRDILHEFTQEFKRIKGNMNSMREHAELLSSVGDDISEYKASGSMSPRAQLLRERATIHGSISHMDDLISQAQATRDRFSLHKIVLFRDDDEDDVSHTSSDAENPQLIHHQILAPDSLCPTQAPIPQPSSGVTVVPNPKPKDNSSCADICVGIEGGSRPNHNSRPGYISPEPHISSQFYTFNKESHALMLKCLRESRPATTEEIRAATSPPVLASWRAVWKDRNEDTAYLTAWKRIQDKLNIHVNPLNGIENICFKNNSNLFISHVDQWQEIVMSLHCETGSKHLGLKETVDRIKQFWTVGAKFYGIPESYIRTCVAACSICSDESSGCMPRNKRRRFEYTESIEVPAKEVPARLQELAAKHKVVLCIRQKYIRYKPFMAEVKDYACHRAGEPASSKKSKMLKREPYASKRCGCGFRIRAIVPISNYNEKDKTFIYEEEGTAVFKLYAVHSGHEPGPLDGNARIMHRIFGHKGGSGMDHDMVDDTGEENEPFDFLGKNDGDLQHSIFHQMQDLRNEVGSIEGKIGKIPTALLDSVSHELFEILNRLRNVGEYCSKSMRLPSDKHDSDGVLFGENDIAEWTEHNHQRLYGDCKDVDLLEDDDDDSFGIGRTLGDVTWAQLRTDCPAEKDLLGETCKTEKWLKCSGFDEKSILDCGDSKLIKPLRHDDTLDPDVGLAGIQIDSFYSDNPKWFDSPCGLDSGTDSGDGEFRHG